MASTTRAISASPLLGKLYCAAGNAGIRKVIVDMSSISPMATKAFAQRINALGADYIDGLFR